MSNKIRTAVLEEANDLITGERASDYGDAYSNFNCIATMWSAYLGGSKKVSAQDVCHMMALLKIARLRVSGGKHWDSSVDGAGYMALGAEMAEGRE